MGVFNYDFLNNYDITKKMYAAGRGLARSTVLKNLEYQTWTDYSWEGFRKDDIKYFRKPMPDGFQPNNEPAPAFVVYTENRMLVKNYQDLTPLDLRPVFTDTSKVEKKFTEFYLKDQQPVAVFLCQFKKTADAIAAESQIKDWESKIPQTSTAKAIEVKIVVGREANFLYMIYSETDEYNSLVEATLKGKVPGK